jgi:hypothetical protein
VLIPFRFTPEPAAAGEGQGRQRETLAFPPADRDRFSLNRAKELARVQQDSDRKP